MSDIYEIISSLKAVAADPLAQVKEFKKRTEKKAVGCFPVYTPAELVYAGGMLPVGLWGGQVSVSAAKSYVPAFTCSIMQSCLELGLRGSYDELSAVIVPSICDTLKCIGQDFKVGVPHIKMIQFTHPQMRKIEAGVNFLRCEYERVLKALEEVCGEKISDEAIAEAITVFNDNRAALRRFIEIAQEHTDVISPSIRHAVIKSGYYMEKPKHTAMVTELCECLSALSKHTGCKRVLLTGIMAEPDSMLEMLSDNGLCIAADDLAQESRQFRYDVPIENGDPLYRLAKWWQIFEGCSLAYDPEKKRIDMIIEDCKRYNAAGVIVCMMKFCDPEEYDYPLLKKALETNEIPALYMEVDQQADINAQAQTRIQAFSEILGI